VNSPETPTPESQPEPPNIDELYRSVITLAYYRAMRIHGDHHHAEDAAQESMLALLRAARTGREIQYPLAYANKVAQDKAIDELKFRSRVSTNSEMVDHALEAHKNNGLHDMIDTVEAVAQAIESLRSPHANDNHLAVIRMTVEGKSDDEISQALGITAGSVRAHLSRARAKLRARREEFGL